MTFHVACASKDAAVMLSDSQGSSPASEDHGLQKQVVGQDFLMGCAGAVVLFDTLLADVWSGTPAAVNASNVETFVTTFIEDRLRPTALGFEVLLVRAGTPPTISRLLPQIFKKFEPVGSVSMLGSGMEFAQSASREANENGCLLPGGTIVDLLMRAFVLAEAANRSLTVDDQLFVGMLNGGKSYMMWDPRFEPRRVPPAIGAMAHDVVSTFEQVRNCIAALRSELRSAHANLSNAWNARLTQLQLHNLTQSAEGLESTKMLLDALLQGYFQRYDAALGR